MCLFKKIFFLLIFIVFLTTAFNFCLAQEEKGRPLEIQYPVIGDKTVPAYVTTLLPDYIKYIFYLAIAISGLLAFGALVYGGVRWLASGGNPASMSDAKDQIFAGILGLVILLSSWLVLNTINPQLLVFKELEAEKVEEVPLPTGVRGATIFYAEKDLQNPVLGLPAAAPEGQQPTQDPNTAALGVIKSVKMESGNAVIFYDLPSFSGNKICLKGEQKDLTSYTFDFGKIVPPFNKGDLTNDIKSIRVVTEDKCSEPGMVFSSKANLVDPILLYRGQDHTDGVVYSYSSVGQGESTKTATEIRSIKIKDSSLAVRFYEKTGRDKTGKIICFVSPGLTTPPCIAPKAWWCAWCTCDTWEDDINSVEIIPVSDCKDPGKTQSPPKDGGGGGSGGGG